MPRYYFHVRDGASLEDAEGKDLSDLEAARREAVRRTGQLLQADCSSFWSGEHWHMDVADGRGLVLFSLHFMAVDAPAVRGPRM